MKTYVVPVVYTISGHIIIQAADLQAAQKEANRLNEVGVSEDALEDTTASSEVMVDELVSAE